MEKKGPNEMEMAKKAYAKRKSKTCAEEIIIFVTKALNRASE